MITNLETVRKRNPEGKLTTYWTYDCICDGCGKFLSNKGKFLSVTKPLLRTGILDYCTPCLVIALKEVRVKAS